jgi:hypothetical protein
MKKVLTVFFLASSSLLLAQSPEDSSKSRVKTDFYIGFGATVQSQFNLNTNLKNGTLPELKETMPELIFGLNFFGEKFSGDAEFGFGSTQNDNANVKNRNVALNSRLRFHYNFVSQEKIALTGGLNVAVNNNQVDVYAKNNIIDLNNFSPSNISHVSLRNQMYFAGPSFSLYFLKHKKNQIRINLGYELAFTNGKWKSDFTEVQNTVKENGNNRFVFGISLL